MTTIHPVDRSLLDSALVRMSSEDAKMSRSAFLFFAKQPADTLLAFESRFIRMLKHPDLRVRSQAACLLLRLAAPTGSDLSEHLADTSHLWDGEMRLHASMAALNESIEPARLWALRSLFEHWTTDEASSDEEREAAGMVVGLMYAPGMPGFEEARADFERANGRPQTTAEARDEGHSLRLELARAAVKEMYGLKEEMLRQEETLRKEEMQLKEEHAERKAKARGLKGETVAGILSRLASGRINQYPSRPGFLPVPPLASLSESTLSRANQHPRSAQLKEALEVARLTKYRVRIHKESSSAAHEEAERALRDAKMKAEDLAWKILVDVRDDQDEEPESEYEEESRMPSSMPMRLTAVVASRRKGTSNGPRTPCAVQTAR